MSENGSSKMVVVCNHADPPHVMPTLIMGASGASIGDDVMLFFCPGGANACCFTIAPISLLQRYRFSFQNVFRCLQIRLICPVSSRYSAPPIHRRWKPGQILRLVTGAI